MNKKEIAEIRRLFTEKRCAITKICGCYVNADKEKAATFENTFLSLDQEELFKYFEILKKSLSGTIGRNLLNMEFPLASEEAGGTQANLLALRNSHLEDEDLLSSFYDRVIESFETPDHYLILLFHQVYDIPGRTGDHEELFDGSEEIYDHIICAICPVNLDKPALTYDGEEHNFHSRMRDWVVDKPEVSFLFPAFNDRQTDLHSILYYTKKPDAPHDELIDALLGAQRPLTAGVQKDVFTDLVEETLGEDMSFELARGLHEQLHELAEQAKESPDPVALGPGEVKNLLELSGATAEQLDTFDQLYEDTVGPREQLMASNIMSTRKYEVQTPDVTVSVSADRPDLVEKRIIDGRPCLVIPITDEVHVNGIRVNPNLADETDIHKIAD